MKLRNVGWKIPGEFCSEIERARGRNWTLGTIYWIMMVDKGLESISDTTAMPSKICFRATIPSQSAGGSQERLIETLSLFKQSRRIHRKKCIVLLCEASWAISIGSWTMIKSIGWDSYAMWNHVQPRALDWAKKSNLDHNQQTINKGVHLRHQGEHDTLKSNFLARKLPQATPPLAHNISASITSPKLSFLSIIR
ncbi:hypothetical protein B0O99DRAFT_179405 [Bisporella sp. PMI_857]|nr:hypothetical protein B0O99DRAFT_179405 [Bisporella sp. PMI_857]